MKPSVQVREKTDDSLQRAVWLAATLGAFRPADLLSRISDDGAKRRALAEQLAGICEEVSVSGAVLWNLEANARRHAFLEMNQAGALRTSELPDFIRKLEPRPDDRFGQHLREALLGNSNSNLSDGADFDNKYAAYEFVGGSQVGINPDRARESAGVLEQGVQRTEADDALVQTIGPRFVGRTREFDALSKFALQGTVSDPQCLKYASPVPGRVPMMFINGIGGAGKSALIAKLAREMREEGSGVRVTILIDFDRPTLAGFNPIELTYEFLRQLAMCLPKFANEISELRRTGLGEFSYAELASANLVSNYSLFERALYSINSRLRDLITRTDVAQQPMLIILDTFEEVLTLGAGFVGRVYRWLDDLQNDVGFSNIRVILSGRASPNDVMPDESAQDLSPQDLRPNLAGAVELGDLEKPEALEFLTGGKISDPELASQLVDIFGGNPLVLRLLNDYADQEGINEVRALLHDKESKQRYQTQVAQRVLYSRILWRIRDDQALRSLASPGLMVRVVTPGVIEKVLAVPCGLGRINSDRAKELFNKLARHVWLVRQRSKFAVTHRRDMRAVMLPLAREPGAGRTREQLTDIAQQIHRNALEYHRAATPDPALTSKEQVEEAFYHELFVDPRSAFSNPDFESVLLGFTGDLADFLFETRAELKRRLGRALSPEEEAALQTEQGSMYRAEKFAQELRQTGAIIAPKVATFKTRARPEAEPAPEQEAPAGAGPREAAVSKSNAKRKKAKRRSPARSLASGDPTSVFAAYARADFEDIAHAAPRMLVEFVERAAKRDVRLERDMTEHYTWLLAMSMVAMPRGTRSDKHGELANYLCGMVMQRLKAISSQSLEDGSDLSLAHYVAAIAVLISAGKNLGPAANGCLQILGKSSLGANKVYLSSMAALRIFQMFAVADKNAGFMFPVAFVHAECLQYFAGLLDPKAIRNRNRKIGAALQAWDYEAPTLHSVHQAVDKLAPKADRPIRSSALSSVERTLLSTKLDLYDWRHPRMKPDKRVASRQLTLPWPALRGVSPDLNGPMLYALREQTRDPRTRRALLRSLAECSGCWPADLAEPITSEKQLSDTFLASVAHYADRFALVPVLFERVKKGSISESVGLLYGALSDLVASVTLGAAPMARTVQRIKSSALAKRRKKR